MAHSTKHFLVQKLQFLVFRTEISTQNDLLSYCPAPGDLLYPEMFLMMKNIESKQPKSPDPTNEVKPQTTLNAVDQHGLWFPVCFKFGV